MTSPVAAPNASPVIGRVLAPTSLVDQAYEVLYARIADGALPPGERLNISRLAQEFGTSAIPIREALARLHANHLVGFEPNRGYRVAAAPTDEDLRFFFQMRLVLETGAADIAVASIDDEALAEMEALNTRITAAADEPSEALEGFREFTELNERFHRLLVGMAGNPLLDQAYERLGDHHQKVRYNAGSGTPDLARIAREHSEITDALRARDAPAVRRVLGRHIAYGYRRLVGEDALPLG